MEEVSSSVAPKASKTWSSLGLLSPAIVAEVPKTKQKRTLSKQFCYSIVFNLIARNGKLTKMAIISYRPPDLNCLLEK